jgi:hypothetical protein
MFDVFWAERCGEVRRHHHRDASGGGQASKGKRTCVVTIKTDGGGGDPFETLFQGDVRRLYAEAHARARSIPLANARRERSSADEG